MTTYWQKLKSAPLGVVKDVFHPGIWSDIKTGLVGLLALLLRILCVLLFPVTVPLLAWFVHYSEQCLVEEELGERARLRRGMHQNGPGT